MYLDSNLDLDFCFYLYLHLYVYLVIKFVFTGAGCLLQLLPVTLHGEYLQTPHCVPKGHQVPLHTSCFLLLSLLLRRAPPPVFSY